MSKWFQVGFFLFFCSHCQVSIAADISEFSGGNKVIVGENAKGESIKILLKTMVFSAQYPKQNDYYPNFGFKGIGYFQPKYSIANFEVWANKNKIGLPVSAYLDLCELHTIDMEVKDEKTFNITIFGGDAADGYQVDLIFKNDILVKRIIRDGEDPDLVDEETDYFTQLRNK